jgi:hypothetical protein
LSPAFSHTGEEGPAPKVPTLRYLLHGVALDSEIVLPEAVRSRVRGPGLLIQRADAPTSDRIEWFHRWRVPAGSRDKQLHTWLSFGRMDDGYLLRFHDLADFEISKAGDRIRCCPMDGLPASTLRHLLLDQILPLVFSYGGRLVLHASAVHVPRLGTLAFAGPAGAGKSTLAAGLAMRGCQLVADDSLLISSRGSAVMVLPGYPGVRLWNESSRRLRLDRSKTSAVAHYTRKQRVRPASLPFRDKASPLRVIFLLGHRRAKGQPSRTCALASRDRLVSLVRYTYLMDVQDRHQLSQMFVNVTTVVDRVPVLRLDVRGGGQSLLRAADEVLALARAAIDS